MVKNNRLFPIVCCIVTTLAAQPTDTIKGIVIDSVTRAPVGSVSVMSGGASATTQSNGTFSLVVAATKAQRRGPAVNRPTLHWKPATKLLSGTALTRHAHIRVHDIAGRTVRVLTYDPDVSTIGMPLSGPAKGVYTVVVPSHGDAEGGSLLAISPFSASGAGPATVCLAAGASQYTLRFSKSGYETRTVVVPAGSGPDSLKIPLLYTSISIPWDWVGVVGTGQSLAVGEGGTPIISTTQPYGNLKLSTGTLAWPIDPADSALKMVPLTEPIGRLAPTYPSSWPTNISGETSHSAMANQVTFMVRASGREHVGVHGEFGENGQAITALCKGATPIGINGRAFEATLIETRAITRLAHESGKTYGVGAITITHGETDRQNADYARDLHKLWADYNTDIKAITGQTHAILMITSQQHSMDDRAKSTLAQWKAGVDYPDAIVCVGPKYQYPYEDQDHLIAEGYRMLGEKYGQVYYERVVCGRNWRPLQPIAAGRKDSVITVRFHVPVLPLKFDGIMQAPHQGMTEWKNGKGFEVWKPNNARVTISSVAITGDSVQITCTTVIEPGTFVGYAMFEDGFMFVPHLGTKRWGLLRDSDPFVGADTRKAQPNYCLAFEMTVH